MKGLFAKSQTNQDKLLEVVKIPSVPTAINIQDQIYFDPNCFALQILDFIP